MPDQYTRMGKQILRNGEHFADGASEDAAVQLLVALNAAEAIRSNP